MGKADIQISEAACIQCDDSNISSADQRALGSLQNGDVSQIFLKTDNNSEAGKDFSRREMSI